MSTSIEGVSYTGFIDYDRVLLKKASLKAKILWLEYRVTKVLIGPLDQIVPPGAPCHSTVHDCNRTFALCGVTLVACAIEALGHFLTGDSDEGGSFRIWVKHYMPEWNKKVSGVQIPDWLWDSGRNGMAHQLAFKIGGAEANDGQRFIERTDGQIEMDPFIFYADFKTGVGRFFQDLKTNVNLQAKFEQRFISTLLT